MIIRFSLIRVVAATALLLSALGCNTSTTPKPAQQTKAQGSTVDEVCRMTAELMRIPRASVQPSTSLGDLNADELDFVELVMELEEHFQITISDETGDALLGPDHEQGLKTVTMAKLAQVVDERKKASQSTP